MKRIELHSTGKYTCNIYAHHPIALSDSSTLCAVPNHKQFMNLFRDRFTSHLVPLRVMMTSFFNGQKMCLDM